MRHSATLTSRYILRIGIYPVVPCVDETLRYVDVTLYPAVVPEQGADVFLEFAKEGSVKQLAEVLRRNPDLIHATDEVCDKCFYICARRQWWKRSDAVKNMHNKLYIIYNLV